MGGKCNYPTILSFEWVVNNLNNSYDVRSITTIITEVADHPLEGEGLVSHLPLSHRGWSHHLLVIGDGVMWPFSKFLRVAATHFKKEFNHLFRVFFFLKIYMVQFRSLILNVQIGYLWSFSLMHFPRIIGSQS